MDRRSQKGIDATFTLWMKYSCNKYLNLNQELIKVNALQVAPAELEAALLEHDDIADAAVVGMTM